MAGFRERPLYLDHNATAPLRPEARRAMIEGLDLLGNPSSIHACGRRARARLEEARERIAAWFGAESDRLVFTSGGTEANHLALHQARGPLLVSAIEHPSVLEAAPGAPRLTVAADGRIDLEALDRDLDALDRRRSGEEAGWLSVMLANNETGALQPVAEVRERAARRGWRLHVDAAQAPGRTDFGICRCGADLLTLSAHKIGGPVGVGALLLAPGIEIEPRARGGGQERGARAGTENLPAILGFAAAVEAIREEEIERIGVLRDRLECELRGEFPEIRVPAGAGPRLCNTSCLLFPGIDARLQVMRLDLEGIMVSAGSACSSGRVRSSHVLEAMGLPAREAGCAIRVSLGWNSEVADVDRFLLAYRRVLGSLRGRRPLALGAAATT